ARIPPIGLHTDPAQRDSDEILANAWALKSFSKRLTELIGAAKVRYMLHEIAKSLHEIVPEDEYR
ncbi:MAG: hypothetical protein KGL35_31340, partial [Bradyrhizobium sp.]|nr:hypothetical protein [Bradyrhizobium sp.]